MRGRSHVSSRYQTLLAFATSILIGLASSSQAAEGVAPDEEQAIRTLLQQQVDAWNRGDLEGFMAGYWRSSELVFTSGGQIQRGWQTTFDKYLTSYGDSTETMGELKFTDLEVHRLDRASAWVLGRWELTGGQSRSGGVFTLVLQRFADGWRVVHDHTSSTAQ